MELKHSVRRERAAIVLSRRVPNRRVTHRAVIGKWKSAPPGKSFGRDQQFVYFHDLAALPLKREISPLDTPKEKRNA